MSLFQNICSLFHDIEDYHDCLTREHECRTGKLMALLGNALGFDQSKCALLNELGSIHDIGKIAIPDTILEKATPLTLFERKIIELHPWIGYKFMGHIKHPYSELAGLVILTHHENYDGTGYPKGLKGEEIPLEGSICAICDVYDALREIRPYRERKTHDEVFSIMCDTGTTGLYHKFKPELLQSFSEISKEIQAIYEI